MEGSSRRAEVRPELLDLIPKDTEWLLRRDNMKECSSDERELELRLGLGPPSHGQGWSTKISTNERDFHQHDTLLSLGYLSSPTTQKKSSFLTAEKKPPISSATDVPNNTSQKRSAAAGAVVGWPPIRSSRKNIASNSGSSKAPLTVIATTNDQSQNNKHNINTNNNNNGLDKTVLESCKKGLFVKINMDGVPIGRKVDLNAYDTYPKLSSAVDHLFRGLLAAQRESSGSGIQEEEKAITGLLDGSGEYILVYEDHEGDRMLVGDVPWKMFVSTVKRLRVLKSSELPALRLVRGKQVQMDRS